MPRDPREGTVIWLCVIALLVSLLGMAADSVSPLLFDSIGALTAVCIIGIVLGLGIVIAAFRATPNGVLYNSFGYMAVAATVYYFFGPLFYVFGPKPAIESLDPILRFSYPVGVWVSFMNLLGISLAGLAFWLIRFPFIERPVLSAASRYQNIPLVPAWIAMSAVGLAAKWFVILPVEFSQVNYTPPGIVRAISGLTTIGILIGWRLSSRRRPLALLFTILLTLLEVVVAFLLLNKTAIVLAVLAALLGRYGRTRRRATLAVGISAIVALYIVASPMVSFARQQIGFDATGHMRSSSVSVRSAIISDYLLSRGGDSQMYASARWWNRLNYLPYQAAAMRFYDVGQGGDLVTKAPWLLVPRALYPDKPVLSNGGVEFTRRLFGTNTSSTGIGVFIDGYYNIGWFGFLLGSLVYGVALRIAFMIARPVAQTGTFVLYPLALSGIFLGLRADGSLLVDVLGWTAILLTIAGCALLAARLLPPRALQRSSSVNVKRQQPNTIR